jgi:uncharacterized membrane protein
VRQWPPFADGIALGAHVGALIVAAGLFLGTHLGISSTPLRATLVRSTGERGYLGIYSLIAVTTLGFLIYAFNRVPHTQFLWAPSVFGRTLAMIVMPFAFVFLLGGFMTRNPTAVGQEKTAAAVGQGQGVLRITRHPFQWAVVLWAFVHVVANGDAASLFFFGSLGLVSLIGTMLMDRKKAITLGAAWPAFAAATSNVPFLAIVQRRNRLVLAELVLPIVVAVGLSALVVWGHRWVSGVSLF